MVILGLSLEYNLDSKELAQGDLPDHVALTSILNRLFDRPHSWGCGRDFLYSEFANGIASQRGSDRGGQCHRLKNRPDRLAEFSHHELSSLHAGGRPAFESSLE